MKVKSAVCKTNKMQKHIDAWWKIMKKKHIDYCLE
jgi:hypothetical protein